MGKKVQAVEHSESESEQEYDDEEQDFSDGGEQGESDMSDDQEEGEQPSRQQMEAKFAYRGIYEKEKILERLDEVEKNFYNRLESARLIKKQGHVPFTEHMSVTHKDPVKVPEQLAVKDEIKREIAFYNTTRDNVMQGMKFLIQSKVPIARPDDFLAEMLKTDKHMLDIKQRLLKQQTKIKTFEENKTKQENKKLHKALKDHKMRAKHSEKKENLKNIEKLKKRISQKGGEQLGDDEFDKIMGGKSHENKNRAGRKGGQGTLDKVREHKRKAKDAAYKNKAKGKKGGFKDKGNKKGGKQGPRVKQNSKRQQGKANKRK